MTVAEIQEEILRMKKNRMSVSWHMRTRDRKSWKLRTIQEIPTASAYRRLKAAQKG